MLLFFWGGFRISLRGRHSKEFVYAMADLVKDYVDAVSIHCEHPK